MRTVKSVLDWQEMDGSTPTVKRLNAYLTDAFIWSEDVPSDECLPEAEELLALWHATEGQDWPQKAAEYLTAQFCTEAESGKVIRLPLVRNLAGIVDQVTRILHGEGWGRQSEEKS